MKIFFWYFCVMVVWVKLVDSFNIFQIFSCICSITYCCSPICTKSPWEVLILERTTYIQSLVYDKFDTSKFCNDIPWSLWTVLAFAMFNENWISCMFFLILFTLWVILVSKSVGRGNSAVAETLTASRSLKIFLVSHSSSITFFSASIHLLHNIHQYSITHSLDIHSWVLHCWMSTLHHLQ